MRNALAVISGLISIAATLPYIIDTLKGRTRPNIVTWFTWASLSCITAVAAFSGHATQTVIFAGGLAIANYAVVIAGLRHGVKHYTHFDVICQLLAIIGIIAWQLTNQPAVAVVFVIVSDLIGALPTYRHIWKHPYEETLKSFVAYLFADVFILASLASYRFISSGYPIYISASSLSIVMLIVFCRRRDPAKPKRPVSKKIR